MVKLLSWLFQNAWTIVKYFSFIKVTYLYAYVAQVSAEFSFQVRCFLCALELWQFAVSSSNQPVLEVVAVLAIVAF